MTESISPNLHRKVRKLVYLLDEARQSRFAISVTRLTVRKSLRLFYCGYGYSATGMAWLLPKHWIDPA